MEWLICFLSHNPAAMVLIVGVGILALVLVGLAITSASANTKEDIRRIGYEARRTLDQSSDDYIKRVRGQTRR